MSYRELQLMAKIKTKLNLDCEHGFLDVNAALAHSAFDITENINDDSVDEAIARAESGFAQNRGWVHAMGEMKKEFPRVHGLRSNELMIKYYYQGAHPGEEMEWNKLKALLRRPADDPRYVFFFAEPSHELSVNAFSVQQDQNALQERHAEQAHIAAITTEAERQSRMILAIASYGDEKTQDLRAAALQKLSPADLQNRYDTVMEGRRLKALPKEQVAAIVKANEIAARPTRYTDAHGQSFEIIPAEFPVPGKDVTLKWSRRLFAKLDVVTSRRLLQRYGAEQVDSVCQ